MDAVTPAAAMVGVHFDGWGLGGGRSGRHDGALSHRPWKRRGVGVTKYHTENGMVYRRSFFQVGR